MRIKDLKQDALFVSPVPTNSFFDFLGLLGLSARVINDEMKKSETGKAVKVSKEVLCVIEYCF